MEKMYVLIRKDLSKSQQAVQGGHALAEFLLTYPDNTWSNGTLVYIGVPNLSVLRDWVVDLENLDKNYVTFYEPDIKQQTALAVLNDGSLFEDEMLL